MSLAINVVPGVMQFESKGVAVTRSPALDALSICPFSCCAARNRRARCVFRVLKALETRCSQPDKCLNNRIRDNSPCVI